jgi:hypothetical protein
MTPRDPRIQQILNQPEIYREIARQDYNVPASQAMPIASHPDIAFRPSCSQIGPVWEPEVTAWVWQGKTIYKVPGQVTATEETLLDLQASGICLTGPEAKDVPLVSTDEVFAQFKQALLTHSSVTSERVLQGSAVPPQPGINWGWMILAPLPMISIGLGIILFSRRARKLIPNGK